MASSDFEISKKEFQDFYQSTYSTLEAAMTAHVTLIRSLLATDLNIAKLKIDGRIKDCNECIAKFERKYRMTIESKSQPYEIKQHISDIIGIRIVCLYEDDIVNIYNLIKDEFNIIDITDKSAEIEGTEASFGYKGLHLDLKLNESRSAMREYAAYADLPFELQIRTVIQDSWSTLDHKIKYKKSIPNHLKRRINTLAALFELADREFRAIRDETAKELAQTEEYRDINLEPPTAEQTQSKTSSSPLDAFSMLRIADHFFPQVEIEADRIDSFTQEILKIQPDITRADFNFYLKKTIDTVRNFKEYIEAQPQKHVISPIPMMRICLYLAEREVFKKILPETGRNWVDKWLTESNQDRLVNDEK